MENHEVAKCVRLGGDKTLEYVAFRLPSRTGAFNQDLYPIFDANEPASDFEKWNSGEDVPAKTMQLKQKAAEAGSSKKKGNFLAKLGKSAPAEESKDQAADNSAALKDEIAALKKQVESLEESLASAKSTGGSESQEDLSTPMELGYWRIRGLGSQCRHILTYCGAKFTEQRYDAVRTEDGWDV